MLPWLATGNDPFWDRYTPGPLYLTLPTMLREPTVFSLVAGYRGTATGRLCLRNLSYSVAIVLKGPTARRGGNFEVPKTVLLLVARESELGFATNSPGRVVGGGGKDTLTIKPLRTPKAPSATPARDAEGQEGNKRSRGHPGSQRSPARTANSDMLAPRSLL